MHDDRYSKMTQKVKESVVPFAALLCIFFFLKADEIISKFDSLDIETQADRERITQEIFNMNYPGYKVVKVKMEVVE